MNHKKPVIIFFLTHVDRKCWNHYILSKYNQAISQLKVCIYKAAATAEDEKCI